MPAFRIPPRVPFKPDKQSNSAQINELLDQAIEILGVSDVSDYRQRIRDATLRLQRLMQTLPTTGSNGSRHPGQKTRVSSIKSIHLNCPKEALDQRIADENAEIEQQQQLLVELKQSFADELSKIGVAGG